MNLLGDRQVDDKHMQFINTFIGEQGICKNKSVYLLYMNNVVDSRPFWLCHNTVLVNYDGFPDWVVDR